MLALFQRKKGSPKPLPAATAPSIASPLDMTSPAPASALLAIPRRQRLLEHIWQRTSVSHRQFAALYRAPIDRYAELVQQFPASESHHHAWPGGMLDHGLEIVAYALKLRQSHLLPPGVTPEAQAAQAEAWTAAAAYAALLHDIGKIAVDLHVEQADGTTWHPWHGSLRQPYRFRFRKERDYRLHSAATGLLYGRVLDAGICDWLCAYPDLWSALLFVLAGQYEHAGLLGELIVQADQASVAQALGGDPSRARAAPLHTLQRKLIDGLRYLVKEELKLNQPQASDGWLTQDALWLVSKTVSDKLRAHLLSQGFEGIPSSNTTLFNVMQDHAVVQPTREGKAIWKATVASDAGWTHSFTLLCVAPSLIWERDARPAPFAGRVTVELDSETPPPQETSQGVTAASADNAPAPPATTATPTDTATAQPGERGASSVHVHAMDDLLALIDAAAPSAPIAAAPIPRDEAVRPAQASVPDPVDPPASAPLDALRTGERFIRWLKQGLRSHKLIINESKALVHTVDGTAFLVSPGLFQRYAQEHPQLATLAQQEDIADWQWAQKQFERLRVHRKQSNGLNIWTCDVTGPRKARRVHGYLLEAPGLLFDSMPPDNPYLSIRQSTQPRSDDTSPNNAPPPR